MTELNRTLTRLWRRLQASIAPGRLFWIDDSQPVQIAQIRVGPDELISDIPIVLHYGLASMPPANTMGIAIFPNGDRGNGVIVATNHPASRLKNLQPGEVALFDDQGRWIFIKRDTIEIEAGGKAVDVKNATTVTIEASTKIVADTPRFECTGDIVAAGDVIADGISLQTHVHGGVTAGGANTGAPL